MKITIKEQFRNNGESWGLEYPIICGYIPQVGWCAWDRHTGEVKFVSTTPNKYLAKQEAIKFAEPKRYDFNPFALDSVP